MTDDLELATLFVNLVAEASDVLREADQAEALPAGLTMALARLAAMVDAATNPEAVRAGLAEEEGPEVGVQSGRMH